MPTNRRRIRRQRRAPQTDQVVAYWRPEVGERDYVAVARRYALDVKAGRQIACKLTRQAVVRHLQDLERSAADPTWPFYFSPAHAADVCGFAEQLPHIEGRWSTPTIHLEPWQAFFLTTLFGWRRREDHGRRFSMAYLEVARKAAKSTIAAVIALYCLTCDGEVGPQIIIGATTGAQAKKVFTPALRMVKRSSRLRETFGLAGWAHSIMCEGNGGIIQTINAKASTQDGWNPHLVILDELHAHRDRSLFDVCRSAFGARTNQLLVIITTAGYNLNGVCYEQRSLVAKVLDGTVEADHYFGVIYTLDEGDDLFDERVWPKANPMLGITPSLASMRAAAREARNSSPSLGEFRTKKLNMWSGAAQAWLNLSLWDACADPSLRLEDFEGQPCWIGGDLSDRDDITAIVLLFMRENGRLVFFPFFYLPAELVAAGAATRGAHYAGWAREGDLILTEGSYIDHNRVEADLRAFCARFDVRAIVLDQWTPQLATSLANDSLPALILPKNSKNWTMPAMELEARLKAGAIAHTGNPALRWMVSNAVISRRVDGSILPKKESAMSPNKIDGIDAMITALSQAMIPVEVESDELIRVI